MKTVKLFFSILIISILIICNGYKSAEPALPGNDEKIKSFHDFTVKTIDGKDYKLSKLKGKKVIVVNTASQCGLTPQYKTLQEIYETIDTSKFQIIAFPANNFLEQDPGTNSEIKEFCQKNYGVTFPVMAKVSVSDYVFKSYPIDTAKAAKTSTDVIYQWLTQKSKNGVMDSKIKWNFQKYLIDENGKLIGMLPPNVCDEILIIRSFFTK